MGGDHAPDVTVRAAVQCARQGIDVILVGDAPRLRELGADRKHISIEHAPDVVRMDEPATSVRRRPEASVRRAVELVAEGRACGVVSCGNSGALFVSALMGLRTMPGVERPGIATVLPRSDRGQLILLDAGANVDCKPELLASFATLGAAYASAMGVARPRVGLLSNGHESTKGNAAVRAALPLIEALPLEVVGNVEPTEALAGHCDVLVCDGFVGNVLLKGVEAAAETVMALWREEVERRRSARLVAALLAGAFSRFRRRVAWNAYGGGLLLGVEGVVVVGHGRASADAIDAAVRMAQRLANTGVVDAVRRRLET